MKRMSFTAVLVFMFFAALPAYAENHGIVFQRWINDKAWVFTADMDGKNERKLFSGHDHDVSKDGSKIAFTLYKPINNDTGRFIAIYDVNTKQTSVLKGIPSTNSYGPLWSPCDTKLLFNTMGTGTGQSWHFGIYDVKEGKLKLLVTEIKPPVKRESRTDVFSPFWRADGKVFYGNDLDYFYEFSADTNRQISTVKADSILPKNAAMSSAVEFRTSQNGKWLFCVELMDESCKRCESLCMKGAIFEYSPSEKKTVRISPKDYCVICADYTHDGRIIFSGHKIGEKKPNPKDNNIFDIYIMNISDKKPQLIIKKGESPKAF